VEAEYLLHKGDYPVVAGKVGGVGRVNDADWNL